MQIDIEIKNSTDSAVIETFTETLGTNLATEEMSFQNLQFKVYASRGMGECSFTLRQDVDSVSLAIGNVIRVKVDGVTQYVGMITDRPVSYRDQTVYSDEINVVADGEILRAGKIGYTLQNDNVDGSNKLTSTNANAVYTDVWTGGQHGGNYTPNKLPLDENCNVTFSAGNNTIPATNINVQYDSVNAYNVVLEMLRTVNGTIDLSSVEPYIYYIDRNNVVYTKQRETSILDTFDIGTYSTYTNFIIDSVDLTEMTRLSEDRDGIVNKLYVNKSAVASTQYSTEELNSQTAYGIAPLYIDADNVGLTQVSTFWDGICLALFEPLETYSIKLNKETYGMNPVFFAAPDGYIRLTKDSGTLYGDYALRYVEYSLDSGGFDISMVIGDNRPNINTIRLKTEENNQTTTPDTTPPTVSALESSPVSVDKVYTQVDPNFYLGAHASDDVGVSSVDFYLSKLNIGTNTWGAWISLGSGALQSAPDAESQDYWELTTGSGYKDLTASPASLVTGDVFKIKYTATDSAGNKGSVENEYQLGKDGYVVTDEIVDGPTKDAWDTPSRTEVIAGSTFTWVLHFPDSSITSVAATYTRVGAAAATLTGTLAASGNEYKWTSVAVTAPANGKTIRLSATAIDVFGDTYTRYRYVKGIQAEKTGPKVTVTDVTAGIDDEDVNVPQFKTKVRFEAYYHEEGWLVKNESGAAHAAFNIYAAGSTTPDLIIKFGNALAPSEDGGAGTGKFYWEGNVSTLLSNGLSNGVHNIAFAMQRTEDFIDENGDPQSNIGDVIEGDKSPFELVGSTVRTRILTEGTRITVTEADIADHDTRLPAAEQGASVAWVDAASDPYTAELKFYAGGTAIPSDPAPDAGGAGWFMASDNGGAGWVRINSDPSGTPVQTFTLNNDQSSEQYIYLKFDSDDGTNKGILRYDKTNGEFKTSVNNGSSYQNLNTGVGTAIEDTFSGTLYRLDMDNATEELTFYEDPDGTPSTKFVLKTDGIIEAYNNYTFISNETYDFGEETYKANRTFTKDINTSASNWSLTWDNTNSITFPDNIAIGFQDG